MRFDTVVLVDTSTVGEASEVGSFKVQPVTKRTTPKLANDFDILNFRFRFIV